MEQKRNDILRLAVAACFGVAAGQAGAAVTLGTSTAVAYALELPTPANLINASNVLDIVIPTIQGLVPTASTPMYVKIDLLNGATFGGIPTLTCTTTAGGVGTAGSIDLGGTVGASSVTFRVTGSMVQSGTCTAAASSIGVTALTTKTVSAVIEYTNGLSPAVVPKVGNYITFQRGVATTFTVPAVGVVVDATSGSDNWVAGGNLTIGTAYIGSVVYSTSPVSAFNSAGASFDAVQAITSATLTVSGPALAASISRGVTGMYLSTVSGCTAADVLSSFTNSASSTSVTFAGLTPTQLSAGVFICATVPGNVVITTGQLTATLAGIPIATTQTLNTTATSNNIANVTANGSTRNAYFVNASSSPSKTSVIRLVNKSGIAGALTATAYNEAGAVLGTANTAMGTLAANQMMTKTSADLETALGFTPASPTAKYSVVFSGALPGFEVLNFSKDVLGAITLSNTSTTDTK